MPGVPGRSGGQNRISPEEHILRGTFRPDRHRRLTEAPSPRPELSAADRRRALDGLTGLARRLALRLLSDYDEWSVAKLETLRAYVHSCGRLEALQTRPSEDSRELHREIRANLNLLHALGLED